MGQSHLRFCYATPVYMRGLGSHTLPRLFITSLALRSERKESYGWVFGRLRKPRSVCGFPQVPRLVKGGNGKRGENLSWCLHCTTTKWHGKRTKVLPFRMGGESAWRCFAYPTSANLRTYSKHRQSHRVYSCPSWNKSKVAAWLLCTHDLAGKGSRP